MRCVLREEAYQSTLHYWGRCCTTSQTTVPFPLFATPQSWHTVTGANDGFGTIVLSSSIRRIPILIGPAMTATSTLRAMTYGDSTTYRTEITTTARSAIGISTSRSPGGNIWRINTGIAGTTIGSVLLSIARYHVKSFFLVSRAI